MRDRHESSSSYVLSRGFQRGGGRPPIRGGPFRGLGVGRGRGRGGGGRVSDFRPPTGMKEPRGGGGSYGHHLHHHSGPPSFATSSRGGGHQGPGRSNSSRQQHHSPPGGASSYHLKSRDHRPHQAPHYGREIPPEHRKSGRREEGYRNSHVGARSRSPLTTRYYDDNTPIPSGDDGHERSRPRSSRSNSHRRKTSRSLSPGSPPPRSRRRRADGQEATAAAPSLPKPIPSKVEDDAGDDMGSPVTSGTRRSRRSARVLSSETPPPLKRSRGEQGNGEKQRVTPVPNNADLDAMRKKYHQREKDTSNAGGHGASLTEERRQDNGEGGVKHLRDLLDDRRTRHREDDQVRREEQSVAMREEKRSHRSEELQRTELSEKNKAREVEQNEREHRRHRQVRDSDTKRTRWPSGGDNQVKQTQERSARGDDERRPPGEYNRHRQHSEGQSDGQHCQPERTPPRASVRHQGLEKDGHQHHHHHHSRHGHQEKPDRLVLLKEHESKDHQHNRHNRPSNISRVSAHDRLGPKLSMQERLGQSKRTDDDEANKSSIRGAGNRGVSCHEEEEEVRLRRRRNYIKLDCPHCKERYLNFKEYSEHLQGYKHQDALQGVKENLQNDIHKLRYRQRQLQRDIEEKLLEEKGSDALPTESLYCHLCKLAHKLTTGEHEDSEMHRKIEKKLQPVCEVCEMRFHTPMPYERHLASIAHIRAVFAAEQAAEDEDDRPGSPAPSSSFDLTSKRDYSGNDDLEEDIRREDDDDFDNFFTVDEIGEVEQQNEELEKASGGGEQEKKSPEKISLEPSKQKTPEPEKKRKTKEVEEVNVKENSKKEVKEEKKSSEDKDIGVEFIKKVVRYYCKLCCKYLPRLSRPEDPPDDLITQHCKDTSHLEVLKKFVKEEEEEAQHSKDKRDRVQDLGQEKTEVDSSAPENEDAKREREVKNEDEEEEEEVELNLGADERFE